MKKRPRPRSVSRRRQPSSLLLPDLPLIGLTLTLMLIGVLFVYEASVVEAYQLFGDKLHFVRLQVVWSLIGLTLTSVIIFLPARLFKSLALPLFLLTTLLLILVLVPGIGSNIQGASRWLQLGAFSFQPSELAKISLVLYLSALFHPKLKIQQFLLILGLLAGLIMLQPDLGTTLTMVSTAFILFFIAGAPLLTTAGLTLLGIFSALGLILTSDYRRERLLTFLNPERDPLGSSYHIRQILISLGSGGLLGTGIGRSLQKYQFLPEPTTDSIFAVIAEETGFFGATLVILLFVAFAVRGVQIASRLEDPFYRLVAIGFTVMISLQAFLNLSAMVALVPLTGITLPFISYGRSSMLTTLAATGILLNLSRFSKKT